MRVCREKGRREDTAENDRGRWSKRRRRDIKVEKWRRDGKEGREDARRTTKEKRDESKDEGMRKVGRKG